MIIAVVIGACLYVAYVAIRNLETVPYQALVMLPEGVVIYKGAKQPEVIDYSPLKNLWVVRERRSGDGTLMLDNTLTGKQQRISLDARFGKTSVTLRDIVNGYLQYQAMRGPANSGSLPPQGPGSPLPGGN